jgi:hypothetical protein
MKSNMNVGAEIFLALGLDHAPAIRKIAATVVFRYLMELHRYGYVDDTQKQIIRICRRFGLGDFIMACAVHYPCRK